MTEAAVVVVFEMPIAGWNVIRDCGDAEAVYCGLEYAIRPAELCRFPVRMRGIVPRWNRSIRRGAGS